MNVAKGYRSKGMNLIDLISEGNLGLIRAIEKFDVEKGFRFLPMQFGGLSSPLVKLLFSKEEKSEFLPIVTIF